MRARALRARLRVGLRLVVAEEDDVLARGELLAHLLDLRLAGDDRGDGVGRRHPRRRQRVEQRLDELVAHLVVVEVVRRLGAVAEDGLVVRPELERLLHVVQHAAEHPGEHVLVVVDVGARLVHLEHVRGEEAPITAMYFSGTLYFSFASASFFSTFCRITCSAAAPFTAAAAFSSSPTIIDGAAARGRGVCTAAARSCAADAEPPVEEGAPHATANMLAETMLLTDTLQKTTAREDMLAKRQVLQDLHQPTCTRSSTHMRCAATPLEGLERGVMGPNSSGIRTRPPRAHGRGGGGAVAPLAGGGGGGSGAIRAPPAVRALAGRATSSASSAADEPLAGLPAALDDDEPVTARATFEFEQSALLERDAWRRRPHPEAAAEAAEPPAPI